ncbi:fibronectin type III domain-containing protein [Desulfosporosinus sp. OT]|uniref:fibronectin type III domain-containing protein n=1 Tax=Desulfosporosinus sp. OT TaxID=913865 RepID=UPI0002239C9B|nr:fibronectin type III domain-containing protein [Desulfosporosinus sp. OT]EGW40149.1 fibronectin type III domain protein [Desulfosporosinus sp. OT]
MNKYLCAVMMSIFMLWGALPAYAEVIDVNIVTETDVNIVPSPPPSKPTDISVSAVTDTTAQVSWPAVTSALQYTVYINDQVYSGSNSPKASIVGLTSDTDYSVFVIANNTGGNSPQSTTVNFKTLPPIPIEPSVPKVTTTGTTAKLLWQPLAKIYNITQYTVFLDGQVMTTAETQTGMQTATLNNLAAGSHSVSVSATNDNREGPQSQPVSFTISTVPAPLGVQFYNKSADTVWLSWQPVPGASSYDLSIDGQQIGQSYQASYIIQSLSPNTTYQISIVTVMPDGEQSQGTNISVQTEPSAPAMNVTNLKSKLFTYVPDLKMYLEILFGITAALMISNNLKVTLGRR